jgi:hypothetical protein
VAAGGVQPLSDIAVQVEVDGAEQLLELGDGAGPGAGIVGRSPCMSQASTTWARGRLQVGRDLAQDGQPGPVGGMVVARHLVRAAMVEMGVADECVHDIEVAVSEACTNVLEQTGPSQEWELRLQVLRGIGDRWARLVRVVTAHIRQHPQQAVRTDARPVCKPSRPEADPSDPTRQAVGRHGYRCPCRPPSGLAIRPL